MKFEINQIMLNNIKLIIWDLDDTFWHGTLSEGEVEKIQENIDLVKLLAKRGIVSSICSKNEQQAVKNELEKQGILDYFIFCSIDWTPKGARIKKIIESMNLRAVNVLFIDDNVTNQGEAEYYLPELMVAGPEIIPSLQASAASLGKDDAQLTRLEQYKVLEKKNQMSTLFSTNEEFLASSHIIIDIRKPECTDAARIEELIKRTNQLNFTKKRIDIEEVNALILDPKIRCGCVYVQDDFGKYGLVGFYAVEDNILLHFLFSCRTMGMGIEQYVYAELGYPELDVVEPVACHVSGNIAAPGYITKGVVVAEKESKCKKIKVLLKGPCDLEVMASYLETYEGLDKEFNFIDSAGMQADFYNHSVNILNSVNLGEGLISSISERYPFISGEAFGTQLFEKEYDYVCISPLMDVTLGVYRNKKDGYLIPYGLYSKPITQVENWNDYINKRVMTARSEFTEDQLRMFSEEFELVTLSAKDIAENYKNIIGKCWERHPDTKFIIIMLPELQYDAPLSSDYLFQGKEQWHIKVNKELRDLFSNDERVILMDINRFVTSQNCYYDSINHYTKIVYYKMAQEFIKILEENEGVHICVSGRGDMLKQHVKRVLQKMYHKYLKKDLF